MSERTPQEVRDDLLARRRRIREEMGSSDRIERQHAKGRLTIRERIDRLLDEGSFMEVGTFARSERREVRDSTPGDGKIGRLGHDRWPPGDRERGRCDGAARVIFGGGRQALPSHL